MRMSIYTAPPTDEEIDQALWVIGRMLRLIYMSSPQEVMEQADPEIIEEMQENGFIYFAQSRWNLTSQGWDILANLELFNNETCGYRVLQPELMEVYCHGL